ncbi:unnamed protein product [Cuscuta campestris]|uniref:TFIIS N-terminal domain-containing protein n=1 Tax=Cuscuta campestris TaxID=132261 RepID=A0A484LAD5_9ASTE|nr:unnamed protein product [Cuscuta campestris]
MQESLQPVGRSPKPNNISMSASLLKHGSDNIQSNVTSISSQVKGKRRERGDQSSAPVMQEHSLKIDDSDSGMCETRSSLKYEISKITERGGLVDFEGVDKLIQLMQPDRLRKMDLISRSMFAGVVAVTDRFDCLNRFVRLRGLPVLDEWLQDVHRGRVGDGNQKDDGKYVEEFLLVLLHALDKLPVNLQALQMCNIGKSVNHLRSHKNIDIQKKARSLVDTWKKRVEAEMNMIDSKSGSAQAIVWPSKSRLTEAPHSANKTSGGSNDVTLKTSVAILSASKAVSLKHSQREPIMKSASPRPLSSSSSPVPGKDSQTRVSISGTPDFSLVKEDTNSGPNQFNKHGQFLSGKEDARNYIAASISNAKISDSSTHHQKGITGISGTSVSESAGQKEISMGRGSSLQKDYVTEKFSQSAVLGERAVDVPVAEVSSDRLGVKRLTRGCSPTNTVSIGSYEDPSIMNSQASAPLISEKYDQYAKGQNDAYELNAASDVNEESWHSNDLKDILTGSDEGEESPAVLPDEGDSKMADDGKTMEVLKVASSSSETCLKAGKLHEVSFSSMNALVESCAKHSEANASILIGDVVGMNLLASVATEEMSKTDRHSPSLMNSSVPNKTCTSDDSRCKSPHFENIRSACIQRKDNLDDINEEVVDVGSSWSVENFHAIKSVVSEASADIKSGTSPEANATRDEHVGSLWNDSKVAGKTNIDGHKKLRERKAICSGGLLMNNNHSANLHDNETSMLDGNLCKAFSSADGKILGRALSSDFSLDGDRKKMVTTGVEPNPCVAASSCDVREKLEMEVLPPSFNRELIADKVLRGEDTQNVVNQFERQVSDTGDVTIVPNVKAYVNTYSTLCTNKGCEEVNVEVRDILLHNCGGSLSEKEISGISGLELEKHVDRNETKFCCILPDKTSDPVSTTTVQNCGVASLSPESSKMKFDLNEGFVTDDGKYSEVATAIAHGCSSVPLPSPVTSLRTSVPASITVASAAKGPFVPPEELLRFKGVVGWKGSAATSAFRPAEPRKVFFMPLSSVVVSQSEASSCKHARPLFNFDLNVPDERVIEEIRDSSAAVIGSNQYDLRNEASDSPSVRSSAGLDLDLNKVDESNDVGQCSVSSVHGFDRQAAHSKPPECGASRSELKRDFDLNNGPVTDDVIVEHSLFLQNIRGSVNFQQASSRLRMNNQEIGRFSSWVPEGSPYSQITSLMPDRGELSFPILSPGAHRILDHAPVGTPFAPGVYRGTVLPSSPAVHFQSASFPCSVFPYGTTIPLQPGSYSLGPSSCIESTSAGRPYAPLVDSHSFGCASTVPPQFLRPYIVGLPDSINNGSTVNDRKWSMQGLDLNAGPRAVDIEEQVESIPYRQLSIVGSQALSEENSRLYPIPGGFLKRKEPEGGLDKDPFGYKPWH